MNISQKIVLEKLDGFVNKYYTNMLLKGAILFVGLGVLYLLFISLLEYFMWFSSYARTLLFVAFIAVELLLLVYFIMTPLFKLWKISKGISLAEASMLIGEHFPSVNDKLLNFLQLSNKQESSELLLASIEQKANGLQIVPFSNAISFVANKKFLPILILPALLCTFLYLSGNGASVGQSFRRVMRFDQQFVPPSPFLLDVMNKSLVVEQGKEFVLVVKAVGSVMPEVATIVIGTEEYVMESASKGAFTYTFSNAIDDVSFFIKSNKVESKRFLLDVVEVPTIANFQMLLSFPRHLKRADEVINGSGNAVVPEGTVVSWTVTTKATSSVSFNNNGRVESFKAYNNIFLFSKKLISNIDYQVVTSNKNLINYETLLYQITTVKDSYPTIDVKSIKDTNGAGSNVYVGQIGDDYGLSKLQIVYYPVGSSTVLKSTIVCGNGVADIFSFSFPGKLSVVKGSLYEYYFEVFDNDMANGFKSSKSALYSDKVLSDSQMEDLVLREQSESISGLAKSLKNQDKQISDLEKIKKMVKEKDNLDYSGRQKVDDFIKRQQKEDEQMRDFTKRMKDNINKNKDSDKAEVKKDLEKRLESQLAEIDKNKQLLEELKNLNNKLKQEDYSEKLDRFKQNSQNQTKNLEQLVELTKRFYVEQKVAQIASKLENLANKQELISDKNTDNTKDNQDKINKEFNELQNEIRELDKDNKELNTPIELSTDENKEKSIDDNLQKASEELNKNNNEGKDKAKPKQKNASKQMKEMASKMKSDLEMDGEEQEEEDAKMLRQILDNLLTFSFSEEQTMSQFKSLKRNSPTYNKSLKQQQDLRLQFQHVDDSLFALGLRNVKISEMINSEVGNVHYNMDKAIENLVEANVSKGVYHQQYTVSSANKLADMLSESLNKMQMSKNGSGKGGSKPKKGKGNGAGMQLPDIIKKQGEIGDKIKNGSKVGDKPGSKPGNGKDGKDGKPSKEGADGDGEGDAGEVLKIYQEQKQLRNALEKALSEKGISTSGQKAINNMKDIEKQLLNKGFKNDLLQKSLNIKQELLKLESALQIQGEDARREAEVSKKDFINGNNTVSPEVKEFMNSIEILNRQVLPLQKFYNNKVQDYFKK